MERIALLALAALLLAPTVASAQNVGDPVRYADAMALFRAHNYRDAVTALDAYLRTYPRDARALVLRGDSRAELDDSRGALADYDAAIAIAPDYEYAFVTRCETRLAVGDDAGALRDCNEAIRLDARDPKAFEDRADVFFDQGNYESALADYATAISLGRDGAYVFAARCDANRLSGNREAARSDCARAAAIDPKNRRLLWSRSRLAVTEARYADALPDLDAYIAGNPDGSDNAYYYRGYALNRLGRWQAALASMTTFVTRKPADPDGYRERGIARYGTGDRAGAVTDLRAASARYRSGGDAAAAAAADALGAGAQDGRPLGPLP